MTEHVFKVTAPTGEERRVTFQGPEMQIGSSIDSTLVLAGNGVSGKHCRISLRGDKLIVTDRGSKNGTFVNSRRCVEPTEFGAGDRLSVGAYVIEFATDMAEARRIEEKLRFDPVALTRSEPEQRAAERRRLSRYAREWAEHARPRRLLLRGPDLSLAVGWMGAAEPRAEVEAEPLLHEFVVASAKAQRVRWAVRLSAAGVLLGAGVVFAVARSDKPPPPEPEPPQEVAVQEVKKTSAPEQVVKEAWIEHTVSPGESYEDIASYYHLSPAVVMGWNPGGAGPPEPGTKLKIRTSLPPRQPLQEERYVVGEGEDWLGIANYYGVSVDKLRRFNPKLGDRLRGGEELLVWIDPGQFEKKTPNPDDLPIFILPEGSSSVGGVTSGALTNPVQLLPSPLAEIRCASHAYATNFTIKQLLRGVADFRAQGYDGQIMIADLSLRGGGAYGPHKSHQSGRDADIWLLVKRKQYLKGCNNCSTEFCRPDPPDVDWRAQWRFIKALHGTGQVKEIFLSHWVQKELHAAAVADGATPEELKKLIQYPRPKGWPALVMHSDGHIHHIHVRFKCDPTDAACSEKK